MYQNSVLQNCCFWKTNETELQDLVQLSLPDNRKKNFTKVSLLSFCLTEKIIIPFLCCKLIPDGILHFSVLSKQNCFVMTPHKILIPFLFCEMLQNGLQLVFCFI
jgi:hypothetical protein